MSSMHSQSGPAIESLESRTFLSATTGTPSLGVSVPGTFPVSYISGAKTNLNITVNLANNGTGVLKAPVTITLFGSQDGTVDANSVQLATTSKRITIRPGKNQNYKLHVASFPQTLNGQYQIFAQVTGNFTPATAGSTGKVTVTPPYIDLTDQVIKVPHSGHIGGKIPVTVAVLNHGNSNAKGVLEVQFATSPFSDGTNGFNLITMTKNINLKASKTQYLHFMVPIIPGAPSGNQFIVATVDPNNTFHEINLLGQPGTSNNDSVSGTPVSIT